jgi:arginase
MTGTATRARPSSGGIALIKAPSHLGLRPPRPGHEPGTWRAPEVLVSAGLEAGLRPASTLELARPSYDFEAQPGTRLRNGRTLHQFNELVADAVDGHSDFRHPGNYDADAVLGAVAGMDLALATGRGEALLTDWDGRPGPLVPDERVVQIGDRETRDADDAWPDVLTSEISMLDVCWVRKHGIPAVLTRAFETLDRFPALPFWLHRDVDVLDQTVMPAVDSPGNPGLAYAEVTALLRGFLASPRCLGLDVTIFDSDLDPDRRYAREVATTLVDGIAPTIESRRKMSAR